MAEYIIKCEEDGTIILCKDFRLGERITRCEDCEFCRKAKCPTSIDIYLCVKNGVDKTYAPGVFVEPYGFCAWAKRKEVK